MPVRASRASPGRGDLRRVAAWGREALAAAGHPRAELSVVLGDDDFVAELNQAWRDKAGPTDVLSFPQDGPGGPLLGDIVISVDTAARQARDHGHDLDAELRVLLVHGICHLLGHDHHEPSEAEAMARREAELLGVLGSGHHGLIARAGLR